MKTGNHPRIRCFQHAAVTALLPEIQAADGDANVGRCRLIKKALLICSIFLKE